MENQPGKDRSRGDQGEQNVGQRDEKGGQREGGIGQQQGNPTGTSGRDTDLQREGNLGNERNRSTGKDQKDQGEESDIGNRPGQNR